jgi:pimeloyl-ACP methyl ester carboxylesterase
MTRAGGRWPRVRRWLKRIALSLLALVILVILVGAIYEALGRRSAAKRFPPPGQLVDIGGRKMHIDCRGTGSPTVVFESGLGSGGSVDWTLVHDKIAGFTRACAYDRAGIMWSDPKSTPQDAAAVTEDLHATLKGAGITDPLVLVGHSIGGPYMTTYVGKYGDQVAGLVMVDPSHPDQIARLEKIVHADLDPRQYLTLVKVASALSWTGVVRFVTSGSQNSKLPEAERAALAAVGPNSVKGSASEVEGHARTQAEARAVKSFGDRPLIVLTAMAPFLPEQMKALKITPAQAAAFKQEWQTLHREQAQMSTRGREQGFVDATHYIQLDRPDVVIAAVREVVDTVRADQAAAHKTR